MYDKKFLWNWILPQIKLKLVISNLRELNLQNLTISTLASDLWNLLLWNIQYCFKLLGEYRNYFESSDEEEEEPVSDDVS